MYLSSPNIGTGALQKDKKSILPGNSFKKYSRKINLRAPWGSSPYFRLNFVWNSTEFFFDVSASLGSKTSPQRIVKNWPQDRRTINLKEEFQQTSLSYNIREVWNKLLQSTTRGDRS